MSVRCKGLERSGQSWKYDRSAILWHGGHALPPYLQFTTSWRESAETTETVPAPAPALVPASGSPWWPQEWWRWASCQAGSGCPPCRWTTGGPACRGWAGRRRSSTRRWPRPPCCTPWSPARSPPPRCGRWRRTWTLKKKMSPDQRINACSSFFLQI